MTNIFRRDAGRQRHDGRRAVEIAGAGRLSANAACYLGTTHAGQVHVHQDHIETLLTTQLQRALSIFGGEYEMPRTFQQPGQNLAVDGHILDQQQTQAVSVRNHPFTARCPHLYIALTRRQAFTGRRRRAHG